MSENAEFYVYKENERTALELYLIKHHIEYDENMSNEELRNLYVRSECGEIRN